MKKTINGIIITLASVVLICGIVATCMTRTINNPKTYISICDDYYYYYPNYTNYAKDGRIKVNYDISTDKSYLYVKDSSVELITRSEYYHRNANNYKILMDKAKRDYQTDRTEENLATYNHAKTQYESSSTTARDFDMSLLITGAKAFFETYFSIVALLMIALLINTKIEYKKRDKN